LKPGAKIEIDLVADAQKEAADLLKRKQTDSEVAGQWINEFLALGEKYFDVVATPAGRAGAAAVAAKSYASLRGLSASANRNSGIAKTPEDTKRPKMHSDYAIPHYPSSAATSPPVPAQSSPPGPQQHTPEAPPSRSSVEITLERTSTF
jgi:hypothetical protein